jgi:hypothetical protein
VFFQVQITNWAQAKKSQKNIRFITFICKITTTPIKSTKPRALQKIILIDKLAYGYLAKPKKIEKKMK